MQVLIYGLEGGLATEIGKNLVLNDINIFLFDNHIITNNDLETGIYYNDINISAANILCSKLQELNSSITVKSVNNLNQKQNVTILINQPKNFVLEVNNFCRQNNSKLVVLYSKGVNGCIFVDACENHLITDETIDFVQILEINNNRIICNRSFNFESDDYVTFDNLEGINLDQFKKEWQFKVINKKTIELVDCNFKDFTFINGTIYNIKKPITVNHKILSEIIIEDKIVNNYLEGILDNYEIMPIVSLFGSLAASEAIKLVTNKFIPINQWFSWEDLELKPKGEFNCQTRLGKMYGHDFEDKLLNSEWLIEGPETFEHLKNLAFIGVTNFVLSETPNILFNKVLNIKSYEKLDDVTGVFSTSRSMDEQCFKYGKPLFTSKTNGLKGSTQPVIPFITDTYSATNVPEQEVSFPLCTIKSFPNEIHHTIVWAIERFSECKFPKDKLYCVKYAVDSFYENYYKSINELLNTFPPNHMIENRLFWSGGKRCPKPIGLNISNKYHFRYIVATTQLFAKTFNYSFTEQEILNYIVNREYGDNDNYCQEFDKNNNDHISWIIAASNMRALNYGIPIASDFEIKRLACNIIPSIPTTTSAVSGLITIEMIKYLLNIKEYRSTTIDFAQPLVNYSKPLDAPMIEIAGKKINSWTKFEYTLDSTLLEFKEYYEKLFETIITMITNDSTILYADFIVDNINKKLKDIVSHNVSLTIMSDDNPDLPNIIIRE